MVIIPKPQFVNVPTINLIDALKYLEHLGYEGVYDRVWYYLCDNEDFANGASITIEIPNSVDDLWHEDKDMDLQKVFEDLQIIKDVWDIKDDHFVAHVSW